MPERRPPAASRACLLLLLATLAGCDLLADHSVSVELRHAADGAGLEAVSVVSGGDDWYWPRIAPGETQRVTLRPGPRDSRELTLLFTLGSVRHDWTGPPVATGAGYRARLDVSADGDVAHRICVKPCGLE